jgi:hypothetical protein
MVLDSLPWFYVICFRLTEIFDVCHCAIVTFHAKAFT